MIVIPALERIGRRILRARGFRTRYVETPAGRVHVYDADARGALPPIVVFHGLSSAATAFTPVLLRLLPHAKRVIAIDHPGHGFSDTPPGILTPPMIYAAADHVLDRLDEPAILVGNSLGGAVALARAVSRPESVRALVLLSPAGSRSSDAEWERIRSVFAIDTRKDALAFFARVYHAPPRILTTLLSFELPRALRRSSIRDILATATNEHAPTPEALRALEMPILFSWGRSERLFGAEQLDWFRAHLPSHAVIEEPEGVGHCPHLDAPAEVAERIVRFAHSA
jgi:pimeloyl-ACP methyl ester carboxylesterase